MIFNSVESSNLKAVGYDPKNKVMGVMFSSGSVYFYLGVTERVWENFKGAESKGKFFGASIKPNYDFFQLEVTTVDLGECKAL